MSKENELLEKSFNDVLKVANDLVNEIWPKDREKGQKLHSILQKAFDSHKQALTLLNGMLKIRRNEQMTNGIYLVVCKNPKALEHLYKEETCCCLIAAKSKRGEAVGQGDALVARDELEAAGFVWGKDFYLKKL